MKTQKAKALVRVGAVMALGGAALGWAPLAMAQATPTIAACTTYGSVVTTPANLAAWDFSDTRATGHNDLTPNALRVWTEGATSTDKAAGYYPTNFALSALGTETITQSLDITTTTGTTPPGLQLVVDFDGDGAPDGILVGEAIYGGPWWLNNNAATFVKTGAPHNGGGYGSAWYGTPQEWLTAFPSARVRAIGYSLGSGVLGDYLINRITLGCVYYTFSNVTAPPQAVPTLWPAALALTGLLLAGLTRRRLRR